MVSIEQRRCRAYMIAEEAAHAVGFAQQVRQPFTWTVRRADDRLELVDSLRDEIARIEDVARDQARVDRRRELLHAIRAIPALAQSRHQVGDGLANAIVV